jgi:hypothetical protein
MTNTVEEVYQAVSQLSEAEQETLMRMMIEQRSPEEKETGMMGDRELWLWQNPSALNSVLRGIEQAAAGEVHDLGSFAEYADLECNACGEIHVFQERAKHSDRMSRVQNPKS